MGHLSIVLLLLQNGASPDIRNIVSVILNGLCFKDHVQCKVYNLYSHKSCCIDGLLAVLEQPLGSFNCSLSLTPAWWDSSPHGSTRRSDGSGSLFAKEWSVSGCHGQSESAVIVSLIFFSNKHISSAQHQSCSLLSSGLPLASLWSVQPFHLSTSGGPDTPSYRLSFGENRYCPVTAAAHGSSRRCHHQWLHPPPHFR